MEGSQQTRSPRRAYLRRLCRHAPCIGLQRLLLGFFNKVQSSRLSSDLAYLRTRVRRLRYRLQTARRPEIFSFHQYAKDLQKADLLGIEKSEIFLIAPSTNLTSTSSPALPTGGEVQAFNKAPALSRSPLILPMHHLGKTFLAVTLVRGLMEGVPISIRMYPWLDRDSTFVATFHLLIYLAALGMAHVTSTHLPCASMTEQNSC